MLARPIKISRVKKMLNPSIPKADAIDDEGPSVLTSFQSPMATMDEVIAEQSVVMVTKAVEVRCGARALVSKMISAAPKRMICGSKAHQLTDGPTNPRICRTPISGRPRFRDFHLQLQELLDQAEHNQSAVQDAI